MRYLVPQYNAVTTAFATSANALHPAANLILATQRLRWEAVDGTVFSASIFGTLQDAGYALPPIPGTGTTVETSYTDLVLSGVFADSVTLQTYIPGGGGAHETPPGLITETFTDPVSGSKTWWFSFDERPGSTDGGYWLTIGKAAGETYTLSASNIFIGHSGTLTGVRYPLDEGIVDTSIVVPLADGSLYTKYRPTLRTFSGQALETRAVASQFLRDAARIGGRATAFHLAPALDDQFYVQAQFGGQMPQSSHALPTLSSLSFTLREVI